MSEIEGDDGTKDVKTQDYLPLSVEGDQSKKGKPWGRIVFLDDIHPSVDLYKNQISFGRNAKNDVTIRHPAVSGTHCYLIRDKDDVIFVKDNSTNGTHVNGKSLQKGQKRVISNGAQIFLIRQSKTDDSRIAFTLFTIKDQAEGQGPLAKYDIRDQIGAGSFASVKVCIDKQTGQKFAMKIIDKKKCGPKLRTAQRAKSLLDEVKILQTLNHENIIKYYDAFETEDHLYLVLELVTGGDLLDQMIAMGDDYPEERAREIFLQILNAVSYLHANGIVHRDLKPENILISKVDGEVGKIKLTDFGLSRIVGEGSFMQTICGTPMYIAPEVIKGMSKDSSKPYKGYDKKIDMWSMGVILFMLLCGEPPFDQRKPQPILEQVALGTYCFPQERAESISGSVQNLVGCLLRVDPEKRYSIEQVKKHPWILGEHLKHPQPTSSPSLPSTFLAKEDEKLIEEDPTLKLEETASPTTKAFTSKDSDKTKGTVKLKLRRLADGPRSSRQSESEFLSMEQTPTALSPSSSTPSVTTSPATPMTPASSQLCSSTPILTPVVEKLFSGISSNFTIGAPISAICSASPLTAATTSTTTVQPSKQPNGYLKSSEHVSHRDDATPIEVDEQSDDDNIYEDDPEPLENLENLGEEMEEEVPSDDFTPPDDKMEKPTTERDKTVPIHGQGTESSTSVPSLVSEFSGSGSGSVGSPTPLTISVTPPATTSTHPRRQTPQASSSDISTASVMSKNTDSSSQSSQSDRKDSPTGTPDLQSRSIRLDSADATDDRSKYRSGMFEAPTPVRLVEKTSESSEDGLDNSAISKSNKRMKDEVLRRRLITPTTNGQTETKALVRNAGQKNSPHWKQDSGFDQPTPNRSEASSATESLSSPSVSQASDSPRPVHVDVNGEHQFAPKEDSKTQLEDHHQLTKSTSSLDQLSHDPHQTQTHNQTHTNHSIINQKKLFMYALEFAKWLGLLYLLYRLVDRFRQQIKR